MPASSAALAKASRSSNRVASGRWPCSTWSNSPIFILTRWLLDDATAVGTTLSLVQPPDLFDCGNEAGAFSVDETREVRCVEIGRRAAGPLEHRGHLRVAHDLAHGIAQPVDDRRGCAPWYEQSRPDVELHIGIAELAEGRNVGQLRRARAAPTGNEAHPPFVHVWLHRPRSLRGDGNLTGKERGERGAAAPVRH